MQKLPLTFGHYQYSSKKVAQQSLRNLYYDVAPDGMEILLPMPGCHPQFDSGVAAEVRGLKKAKGVLYSVVADKFYQVDEDGSFTERGTLNTSAGALQIEFNSLQIMIHDYTSGYIYTLSDNSFVEITDEDFPTPNGLTFQDGFFLVLARSTGQIWKSGALDGTTWAPLDFTTAEANPDDAIGILSSQRELLIMGTDTIEPFYNSGNADFPFERIDGVLIEEGLAAKRAYAKLDNTIYWLSTELNIMRVGENYQAVNVSNSTIASEINSYSSVEDAFFYDLEFEGNAFLVCVFPSGKATWVYNAKNQGWNKWDSYPDDDYHRGNCYEYAYGMYLAGDRDNGIIYKLDKDVFTDNNQMIKRIFTIPRIRLNRDFIFLHTLEFNMEYGVGLDAAVQGSDPKMNMRYSTDNGNNWSNYREVSLGKIGQYDNVIRYNGLGGGIEFDIECRITDPVRTVISNPYGNISLGRR